MKQYTSPQGFQQRRVTQELNRVAEPLLRAQEDRATVEILPRPRGPLRIRASRKRGWPQLPEFVLIPSFRELSARQQRVRIRKMPFDGRPLRQIAPEDFDCFVDASQFAQTDPQVGETFAIFVVLHFELLRPCEGSECFVVTSLPAQGHTEVIPGRGSFGVHRQGAPGLSLSLDKISLRDRAIGKSDDAVEVPRLQLEHALEARRGFAQLTACLQR